MAIFKTTTPNLMSMMGMYAGFVLKEAAEKVIAEKVASYKEEVTKAVYAEAEKICLKFQEELSKDSLEKGLRLIIDDRREKIK